MKEKLATCSTDRAGLLLSVLSAYNAGAWKFEKDRDGVQPRTACTDLEHLRKLVVRPATQFRR